VLIVIAGLADGAARATGQDALKGSPAGMEDAAMGRAAAMDALPDAPDEVSRLMAPAFPKAASIAGGGGKEPFDIEPQVTVHQDPFSRAAIGVDISPLGVGVSSAILLTEIFDARLTGNYFAYNNGRIEVDEFNIIGGVHLASARAAVDLYPFNAPIRLSAGLLFYNDNHAAAQLRINPGASFTMGSQTFYAGGTSAAPLTGGVAVGFHSIRPAPTLSFGFGKMIPRSQRHWSLPSEFGVAFTGAPSINVGLTGTVCTDAALTNCGNAADSSSPVGAQFNSALQAKLAGWRRSLGRVPFFPILLGGVTYSFDTPWQWKPKAKF